MLKKFLNRTRFPLRDAVAGFLVAVRLSGRRQNGGCRLTEEAHQSLDVLSYRCQEGGSNLDGFFRHQLDSGLRVPEMCRSQERFKRSVNFCVLIRRDFLRFARELDIRP